MADNGGSGKIPAWTPAGGICGRFGAVRLDASCRGVVVAAEGEYGDAARWCVWSSRALMVVVGRQAAARAGAPVGGAGLMACCAGDLVGQARARGGGRHGSQGGGAELGRARGGEPGAVG
jgi:hypothetical protein